MSEQDELVPTRAAEAPAVFLCAGQTRFNKPCTNRVRVQGGFCGRCSGSRLAPLPAPGADEPDAQTPATPPKQELPPLITRPPRTAINEWTVANELVARLTPHAAGDAELLALIEVGARLAENSRAQNTQASYRQHYRTFESFGDAYGLPTEPPVEPEVVAYFISYLAAAGRLDRSTGERTGDPLSHGYLRQAVSAIGHRHTINGLGDPTEDPIVRGLLDGYAKVHGSDVEGKDPIHGHQLALIAEELSKPDPKATRNLAISLLATHPALRLSASALVGLDAEHILLPDRLDEPMILLVSRQGTTALSPLEVWPESDSAICPVGAVRALDYEPFGPLFRSAPTKRLTRNALVAVVATAVERAGIRPANVEDRLPRLSGEDRNKISVILNRGPANDIRDRALITNLYWGCFRASELVGRDWRHARFVDQGLEWKIPKDKSNQEGKDPRVTGVPRHPDPWLCPVLALEEWRSTLEGLHGRPIKASDPVFPTLDRRTRMTTRMSVQAANQAVQSAVARIGLKGDFGSHSLRAGFSTDALDAGATREQVQHHGGWKNVKSLDSYIRKSSTWADTNPALWMIRQER